jgi:hypothetical protein
LHTATPRIRAKPAWVPMEPPRSAQFNDQGSEDHQVGAGASMGMMLQFVVFGH